MGALGWLLNLGFAGGGAAAAVAITITLPDATWDGNGSAPRVIVKEVAGSSNTIAVTGATISSVQQTIDGSTSLNIAKAFGYALFISDKVNWMAFANPDTTGILNVVTITSDTTLTVGNDLVLVDASAGAVDVTMLAPGSKIGKVARVKKIDSTTNLVTLVATIDGATNAVITDEDEAITVASDGTGLHIV